MGATKFHLGLSDSGHEQPGLLHQPQVGRYMQAEIHRENGGTLGMVPLIINPIYTRIFEQPTLILIGWMRKSKSTYLLEAFKSFSCVLTGVCQRRNACIYILTLCQCLWPACTTANGSESSQPVEVGSLSDIIYEFFYLHPFRGWSDFWTVEDPTKCVQIHHFWPNYIISPT